MIVKQIDLKHHIDEQGRIIKSTNGQPIPDDEPLMLFRGRDHLAIPMLLNYRLLCEHDGCNEFQLEQVDGLIRKFKQWAAENPDKMKQPGITRGA